MLTVLACALLFSLGRNGTNQRERFARMSRYHVVPPRGMGRSRVELLRTFLLSLCCGPPSPCPSKVGGHVLREGGKNMTEPRLTLPQDNFLLLATLIGPERASFTCTLMTFIELVGGSVSSESSRDGTDHPAKSDESRRGFARYLDGTHVFSFYSLRFRT